MRYENLRITEIDDEYIILENADKEKLKVYSNHDTECCEIHYLDFSEIEDMLEDNMLFCIDTEDPSSFFCKVEGFGIRMLPVNGHPVSVPGYGRNNGYYSSDMELVVEDMRFHKEVLNIDVSECQDIRWK